MTGTDFNEGCIYYPTNDKKHTLSIDDSLRREALQQRDRTLHTFQNQREPEGRCKKCESSNVQSRALTQEDNTNKATSTISAKAQNIKKI